MVEPVAKCLCEQAGRREINDEEAKPLKAESRQETAPSIAVALVSKHCATILNSSRPATTGGALCFHFLDRLIIGDGVLLVPS